MNKRGTMMVEAVITLPIIIMISLSIIFYSIYQFENFNLQCRIHQKLGYCQPMEATPFYIDSLERENSIDLGGLSDGILHKSITGEKYVINYPLIVRIGNVVKE